MTKSRKAQVSVELMIVIGFILVFFLPLLLISYFKVIELNHDLSAIQSQVAVSRLANTIDSVGRMGVGSSLLLDVYLPANSELTFNSYSSGGEIVLYINSSSNFIEVVEPTWFPILDVQPLDITGNYRFNITSKDDGVSVVPY